MPFCKGLYLYDVIQDKGQSKAVQEINVRQKYGYRWRKGFPAQSMGFQALAPEKVRLADNDGLMPRDESEGVFPEKVPFRERFL